MVNPLATSACKSARVWKEPEMASTVLAMLEKLERAVVYASRSPVILPYKELYRESFPWFSIMAAVLSSISFVASAIRLSQAAPLPVD